MEAGAGEFGGGSDTQAVLRGRGACSGRGRAGLAGSARFPAGLTGIGSIRISLGGLGSCWAGYRFSCLYCASRFTNRLHIPSWMILSPRWGGLKSLIIILFFFF